MKRYYFDWAATALPLNSDAAPVPFGNPSSRHTEGRAAFGALEEARERAAVVLGVKPEQLYFTSGATESNTIVFQALLYAALTHGTRCALLASAVEHPSVRENCLRMERLAFPVQFAGVERDGRVSAETLRRALEKRPGVALAAIMAVNNETGAVMDIAALTRIIRERAGRPVQVHCDLVQAAGKTPVDIAGWDIDSASVSAHKLGGPRGAGLLYTRKNLESLSAGGHQERGLRPGTENVSGALALARALEQRAATLTAEYTRASERMAVLLGALRAEARCTLIPPDRGAVDGRFSPYIVQAAFSGIPGEVMVRALDEAGFAVSTGSACSSASGERPVLAAMGVDERTAFEGIRISQGWTTTVDDIERLAGAIQAVLQVL